MPEWIIVAIVAFVGAWWSSYRIAKSYGAGRGLLIALGCFIGAVSCWASGVNQPGISGLGAALFALFVLAPATVAAIIGAVTGAGKHKTAQDAHNP